MFLETLVVSPTLIDHMILLELIDLEYNVAFIKNRKFLVAQIVKSLPAMQETWVWSLGGEDPLKKEMAIHFSILTWRNSWNEEPGRLQSNGSQRAGLDWATNTFTFNIFSEELIAGILTLKEWLKECL